MATRSNFSLKSFSHMDNFTEFTEALSSTGGGLIDSIVAFIEGIFGAVEGLLSSETPSTTGSSQE